MAVRSIIRRCHFPISSPDSARTKRPQLIAADSPVHPSKALPKFLSSLNARPQRLLLDLGPVVGTNVTFFGEELGCKILVENLFKDIERHVSEGKLEALPPFFGIASRKKRAQSTASSAGTSSTTSTKPRRRPSHGTWSGCCGPTECYSRNSTLWKRQTQAPPAYTQYLVADRQTLQYRSYPAARGKQRPLINRDIQRLFEPLRITEQFLLKNNLREVLFRKPPAAAAQRRRRACQSSPC